MKTTKQFLLGAMASSLLILSCQKNANDHTLPVNSESAVINAPSGNTSTNARDEGVTSGQCNSSAYIIVLESRTQVGSHWEWVWSVQNSNPGNGYNGTVQDLSHWGMQFGPCVTISSLVGAAYSADGIVWTSFAPVYEPETSQGCMTTSVLKFDYGTTGSSKSYYKLIVNANYEVGISAGYYKSGKVTRCCTFNFTGIGCIGGLIR